MNYEVLAEGSRGIRLPPQLEVPIWHFKSPGAGITDCDTRRRTWSARSLRNTVETMATPTLPI